MKTLVTAGSETLTVEIARGTDDVEATVDGTTLHTEIERDGERWRVTVADRTVAAVVVRDGEHVWVAIEGEVHRCTPRPEERSAAGAGGARSPRVTAPMPGKVLDVRVEPGQQVAAGDPLVVLEAMKMETVATAEAAGRIVAVHVTAGSMVEPGQALIDLEFT